MLIPFSAILVAVLSLQFQGTVRPSSLSSRDSARVLGVARRAQGDFETLRRRLLPFESLRDGGACEDFIGPYCYRHQYSTPPTESPEVVSSRTHLLRMLDSAGTLIPGDRWIVGQQLRYLIEAGRSGSADSIAIACVARAASAATQSWCLALTGYIAQQLGNYSRADAAYTAALAVMPQSERCEWEDVALFLGRSAARPYRNGDCLGRDSAMAGFWRLVQPLYLKEVNDLRTELLARITRMYIERDSRTAMSDRWGPADRTALLRYGVPLWYTRGESAPGESRPGIAGFRREPSFNFFPDARVFAAPDRLSPTDWNLTDAFDAPTYAPLWASDFQPITDYQVALFRRGDSALVVTAFMADDRADRAETRQVGAFAAVIDRGGVRTPVGTTIVQAGRDVVATLVAPWRPLVVSLEALNQSRGSAWRARFAPRLPAADRRMGLSDLLLYSPRGSSPGSLADAVRNVLHAMRVPRDRQLGLFWEAYGLRSEGESLNYTLLVERVDSNPLRRVLAMLHLVSETPIALQWREAASPAGDIAARGMTVDLSRLEPGNYSVRLMMQSGIDAPIVSERSINIL